MTPIFSPGSLPTLIHEYGYVAIFALLMLECIGLPLPGESLMIAAAVYAATTHRLSVVLIAVAAASGTIVGAQLGYLLGRWFGDHLLGRWGPRIGLSPERLQFGRYLFERYGGSVIFFGRFVAFLRTLAALLAGAARMPWQTFLIWNVLGGIAWTFLFTFGAFTLGDAAKRLGGPIGTAIAVAGAVAFVAFVVFIKRNEKRLMEEARKTYGAPQ